MQTKIIKFDPAKDDAKKLEPAAQALRAGEVVCFPTETVYGLGAVWDDFDAVEDIFKIKGRPQDNPLITHVASIEEMKDYFLFWDEIADCLTKAFCPGPFTLIMPKAKSVNSPVTAGLNTIGVRIPINKAAHELIKLVGTGIAAPSANISGKPSPTNAQDAYEDLANKVPYIIDAGASKVGVESSIVSWDGKHLELLRPGAVSAQDINDVLKENNIDLKISEKTVVLKADEHPKAPGMKYRHYAPNANVHIIEGNDLEEKCNNLSKAIDEDAKNKAYKPALFVSEALFKNVEKTELINKLKSLNYELIVFSDFESAKAGAHGLFSAFRKFDRLKASDIYVEAIPETGVGAAYMNRLRKASSKK